MKRALYLDGGEAPLFVATDGPALRIRREGRADGRAPLRLVSRIIVRGRVGWQTEALIACMDADVPVAFVTADGTTRGWCIGARGGTDEDINTLLEDCVVRQDWRDRHEDWLSAMERRAMIRRLPARRPIPDGLRPGDLWAAEEARLERLRPPVEVGMIFGALGGALDAHLAELFRRAGVAARFVLGHGEPVCLLASFHRVLIWDLWPAAEGAASYFCRHGIKRGGEREVRRRLVRRYEASAPAIDKRFRELFWRLRLHLRDLLP